MTERARRPRKATRTDAARVVAPVSSGDVLGHATPPQSLYVAIPGPAVPWQRTATYQGKRLTPAAQRAYQARVRSLVAVAVASLPRLWSRSGRYGVAIVYVPQDKRRRDIDNIAKSVLDAISGVAWEDDSQVDALSITRTAPTSEPCVYLTVTAL